MIAGTWWPSWWHAWRRLVSTTRWGPVSCASRVPGRVGPAQCNPASQLACSCHTLSTPSPLNVPLHFPLLSEINCAEWYLQQLAASDALLYRLRYGALAPPLTAAEQLQARRGVKVQRQFSSKGSCSACSGACRPTSLRFACTAAFGVLAAAAHMPRRPPRCAGHAGAAGPQRTRPGGAGQRPAGQR